MKGKGELFIQARGRGIDGVQLKVFISKNKRLDIQKSRITEGFRMNFYKYLFYLIREERGHGYGRRRRISLM